VAEATNPSDGKRLRGSLPRAAPCTSLSTPLHVAFGSLGSFPPIQRRVVESRAHCPEERTARIPYALCAPSLLGSRWLQSNHPPRVIFPLHIGASPLLPLVLFCSCVVVVVVVHIAAPLGVPPRAMLLCISRFVRSLLCSAFRSCGRGLNVAEGRDTSLRRCEMFYLLSQANLSATDDELTTMYSLHAANARPLNQYCPPSRAIAHSVFGTIIFPIAFAPYSWTTRSPQPPSVCP
jgi:hypothetical protein